jgi:YhcH/YjgK/YiaL family protein
MILDSLAQSSQYEALSPRFAKAFAFLRGMSAQLAPGRHEIAGDEVYASVQRHLTKPVAEKQYESHRKYIDIQYIHSGREIMYWAPLPLLAKNVTMQYDEKGDALLYSLIPEGVPLQVSAGQFAIFYPQDGHVPSCSWGDPAEVFKVVVKVLV